jgi:nicotinamide-nucleotide amidase
MGALPREDLVTAIARAALSVGLSIATAESLTSGLVTSELGKGPDAAKWLRGGVVAYSTAVKQDVLGVRPGPVVTTRCAEQMATGAARLLRADVSVSTTGVGGPDPVEGQPPGTVHLGWWHQGRSGSRSYQFDGDPERVVESTVNASLELLRALIAEA